MKGTNYTSIGYNFLQLTINSIEELEKQGNKRAVAMGGELSEEEFWFEFEKRTKWNDQNIAIPVLFNFFHGVELMLKGLIFFCGGELANKTHKLSHLLNSLKKNS